MFETIGVFLLLLLYLSLIKQKMVKILTAYSGVLRLATVETFKWLPDLAFYREDAVSFREDW